MPTKTWEYLAAGLPIIAYGASDELARVVEISKAGIFIRGGDYSEIASNLIALLEDKRRMEEFSRNGRTFTQRCTEENSIVRHLSEL